MLRKFKWVGPTVVVVVAALSVAAASLAATQRSAVHSSGLGARLVNRFFSELKRHDSAGLRRFLSPAFQIQRADGSRLTKEQYLNNLPKVLSYKLRDLRTTSTRTAVTVTYQAATTEIINSKKTKSGFAPRLSVFLLAPGGWQLVGHGNFNPPA
jgi:hypothetical protein